MRHPLAILSVSVFAAAALTAPLWAEMDKETVLGDLRIEAPMLRETPPNAPVASGFLTIENTGDADDVLIGASIAGDIAGVVELHEMAMNEGVMSMSEVEGGIAIPAGQTVTLVPGGLHIMLMGLTQPLVAGEAHEVTLTFERAGAATLAFPVLTLPEIRAVVEADGGHGGHGDHGNHGN